MKASILIPGAFAKTRKRLATFSVGMVFAEMVAIDRARAQR